MAHNSHHKALLFSLITFSIAGVSAGFVSEMATQGFMASSFIQQYFEQNAKIIKADKQTNTFDDFFNNRVVQKEKQIEQANGGIDLGTLKQELAKNTYQGERDMVLLSSAPESDCADLEKQLQVLQTDNSRLRRRLGLFRIGR